jgi:hypothetical protein
MIVGSALVTVHSKLDRDHNFQLFRDLHKQRNTPQLLTGLALGCKASKWLVVMRKSQHDIAARDSGDKYHISGNSFHH